MFPFGYTRDCKSSRNKPGREAAPSHESCPSHEFEMSYKRRPANPNQLLAFNGWGGEVCVCVSSFGMWGPSFETPVAHVLVWREDRVSRSLEVLPCFAVKKSVVALEDGVKKKRFRGGGGLEKHSSSTAAPTPRTNFSTKRRKKKKSDLMFLSFFSRVAHGLGAPLAVIDALADADHAAGGGVVSRGGLLHPGALQAAEDLDGCDWRADGVHGAAVSHFGGGGGGRGAGGGGGAAVPCEPP